MSRKKIAKQGRNVRVHYTGTLDDGTVFDTSRGRDPISFEVGSGTVIAGFDQAVVGLKVGESKVVRIASEDAYGSRNENAVLVVPRDSFPENMQITTGMQVQGTGPQGEFPAIVTAVASNGITIDMNHPLAGQDLNFEIEVIEIDTSA